MTVTVKAKNGYKLDKLTVTDAKGTTIEVTDKGDGKFTFTMPNNAAYCLSEQIRL